MTYTNESLDLFRNAVILKIEVGAPGNSRQLDDDQYEVDADKARTRASKRLLESPEAQRAIKKLRRAKARVVKFSNPSPLGRGTFLLSIAGIRKARQILTDAWQEFLTVDVPAIRANYDLRIAEAKQALNGLFNPDDYSTVDEFIGEFVLDSDFVSFDTPGVLEAIDPDLYAAQTRKNAAKAEASATTIPVKLAQKLEKLTQNLIDRCGKISRGDSTKPAALLENIAEFIEDLPLLNIVGNEDLARAAKKASEILRGVDSETLREDKGKREWVENELETVKAELAAVLRPTRAFAA